MGVLGLITLYAAIKLITLPFSGGSKAEEHQPAAVAYPSAKRDFAKEKEEFVANYVAAELKKHEHHH